MNGRIHTVVGGQFGSEAKGHVAAILARRAEGLTAACVRVGGPNAGHSVVDGTGLVWPFRTIPVASVVSTMPLILGPGSEIEIEVLHDEFQRLYDVGWVINGRLFIDSQATILSGQDYSAEANLLLTDRLGSTGKGIGSARSRRILRSAPIAADFLHELSAYGTVCDTRNILRPILRNGVVIIEGTQGYGLGLHAGSYPFCTSGDCRSIDFVAQAGLGFSHQVTTWIVYRTFPIRVAGNSGPMSDEITWGELTTRSDGYIQPEKTTVTKKIRRVARWDPDLALAALEANMPAQTVLTFVDYLDPSLAGCTEWEALQKSPAMNWIAEAEMNLGQTFRLFTTGPNTHVWRYGVAPSDLRSA